MIRPPAFAVEPVADAAGILPGSPTIWALTLIIGALVSLLGYIARLAAVGKWVPRQAQEDTLAREARLWVALQRTEDVRELQAQTLVQMLEALRGVGVVVAAIPVATPDEGRSK